MLWTEKGRAARYALMGRTSTMKLSVRTVGTEVVPSGNLEEAVWQGDQSQSPDPKGTLIGKLQKEETVIAPPCA